MTALDFGKKILSAACDESVCLIAAASLVTLIIWLLLCLVIELSFNEGTSYQLQVFLSIASAFILEVIAFVGYKRKYFYFSFFSRVHSFASDRFIFPEHTSFSNFGKHKVSWSVRLGVWLHYFFSKKFLSLAFSFFRWIFDNSERITSFLKLLGLILTICFSFLPPIFSN